MRVVFAGLLMLPPGGVMTLGILEGIPADAVLVDDADDCTKIDVGGINEVIVSLPVGTSENGAAEVEAVTMTGGMIAAEVETPVVAMTAALVETSVAAEDNTGVAVALTDAIVVATVPLVGPTEPVDKEPEPAPLIGVVVAVVSVPVVVALAEDGPEGVEPTSVPETEAEADDPGATVALSVPVDATTLAVVGAVPDTGTTLMGVPLEEGVKSVEPDDTTGTMATPLEELTAVPTALDIPETTSETEAVGVPVAAPVSPELSTGEAAADDGVAEGTAGRLEPEMMVDSPTMMPVAAELEGAALVGVAARDDGCKTVAGALPLDPATTEEDAGLATAGIIESTEEEALGVGDDAGTMESGSPLDDASKLLVAGTRVAIELAIESEDDAGIMEVGSPLDEASRLLVTGTRVATEAIDDERAGSDEDEISRVLAVSRTPAEEDDATTATEDDGVVSTRVDAEMVAAELDGAGSAELGTETTALEATEETEAADATTDKDVRAGDAADEETAATDTTGEDTGGSDDAEETAATDATDEETGSGDADTEDTVASEANTELDIGVVDAADAADALDALTSDAGTGLTKAVDTTTSVEVGLDVSVSVLEDGSTVSEVDTTADVVEFENSRFMCRGK
jgi:hypothetical protein